jgi:hypothetical protein
VIAGLLLAWVAWGIVGAGDGFARFEAAWVCLLAGGVAVALLVRPPGQHALIAGGLVAVAVAALAGATLLAVTASSWAELRWLAEKHYGDQVRLVLGALSQRLAPAGDESTLMVALEQTAAAVVLTVSRLLPALVLLQSLAALAFAWTLYRVVAREPEGVSLPSLREFRFNDHLVWGIVVAAVALVWPGHDALRLLGGNLATFFGGLYVLRGLGVVAAMAAAAGVTGPAAGLVAAVVTVFLPPIAVLGALAFGVSDTWLDWRRRLAQRVKGG